MYRFVGAAFDKALSIGCAENNNYSRSVEEREVPIHHNQIKRLRLAGVAPNDAGQPPGAAQISQPTATLTLLYTSTCIKGAHNRIMAGVHLITLRRLSLFRW